MSDIKLKECPFCGGEAKIIKQGHREYAPTYYVRCTTIFCRIATPHYKKEAEVIRIWNTRKPMDRIVEQLEEYQDNNSQNKSTDDYELGVFNTIEKTIELVKAGGVE